MTHKKVILRKPKVLESLGPGVMEYWSVEIEAFRVPG
jgi:hypothetical protein